MRLALLVAALASACSQVVELLPNAQGGGPGAPCGNCAAGLTCFTGTATNPGEFPGGLCSRPCAAPSDCPDGTCATIDTISLCLTSCDPSAGATCRDGYACCAGQHVVSSAGWCAPSSSSFCGG